jgi:hypothetical protein
VTGNDLGFTSSASLTVTTGPLDHLVLARARRRSTPAGRRPYTAEGRDQYDNTLGDVTATTTFSISRTARAPARPVRLRIRRAHGHRTKSGKTGTATLQVSAGTLDHIVISPASATIAAGGSQGYTAQGFDSAGNPVGDVTAFTTFSISPNGTCTGATCTATTAGAHTVTGNDAGKTSTASLTVNPGSLDHLALTPTSATIAAGGAQAYTAQGRDQYDNSLGDVTAATTFSIAPTGSCTAASCTATAAGGYTVTGTSNGKTGTASLTVTRGCPRSPRALAGLGDDHGRRLAGVHGRGPRPVRQLARGSHRVDDLLDCPRRLVHRCDVHGLHRRGAYRHGNKERQDRTASLQVNPAVVDHIVISPASATIGAGGSQTYTAEGFDASNNSLGDVTAFTTFSIAPNGACSAPRAPQRQRARTTVTGNDGGATSTASLTVTAGTLDHLVLSPSSRDDQRRRVAGLHGRGA